MPARKKPNADETTPKAPAKKTPAKKASAKKPKAEAEAAFVSPESAEPKVAKKAAPKKTPNKVPPAKEATPRPKDNVDRSKFKDLLIVESPTKIKTIGKYLGGQYTILASYGHVRDLATGRKQKGEEVTGVQIASGWVPRYVNIDRNKGKAGQGGRGNRRSTEDILAEIAQAADKSNRIFLATDPDREGEAIAWHLAEALNLDPARTFRITFNEITKSALQHALANPQQIHMDRVSAQEARRMLDRVVGFPLSGYLRDALRLSATGAGRVQSVAVKLIVDREREIEAFKPEEFWKITALLAPQGTVKYTADPKKAKVYHKKKGEGKAQDEAEGKAQDEAEGGEEGQATPQIVTKIPPGSFTAELSRWEGNEFRPNTEKDTDAVYARLVKASYTVTKIEQTDKPERPQPPFTTSTLQQAAAGRLHFTAQQTMSVAQALYQGAQLGSDGQVGLITYMRTDSTKISNDAMKMVRDHIQSAYGPKYLPNSPQSYPSGKSAQEAHEAIRPTDLNYTPQRVQPYLNPQQFRLYELIYNRFVACQMANAIFAETNVEVTADKGLFKAKGKIEKFDGYRKVHARSKSEDVTLPPLQEKQTLDKLDLTASQHFTQPPPRFNEASLVKRLEKEGIGRPSTYAAIIAKIQDHGHVKLEQRRFFATEIGKKATDLLTAGFPKILDLKFTSHIEEELDDIESGKIKNTDVLDEFWSPFDAALKTAKAGVSHETGEMCPKCGQPLINRMSKTTGKGFVGCSGWKKDGTGCDYIKPGEGEAERPAAVDVGIPCPTCGKPMLQKVSRFGTTFLSCSGYKTDGSGCNTTGNLVDGKLELTVQPTKHPCPKCGKMLLLRQGKNGPFLACPDNKKCKAIVDADAQGNPKKEPDLGIVCEKCGSPMRIRTSFRGPFLSCSAYPKCRNAKSINAELREKLKDHLPAMPAKKDQPTVEVSEKCPQCAGPMKVRMGRGKPFLGCGNYPKCKGTLPCPPEVLEKVQPGAKETV